jgi:hypothetical protein
VAGDWPCEISLDGILVARLSPATPSQADDRGRPSNKNYQPGRQRKAPRMEQSYLGNVSNGNLACSFFSPTQGGHDARIAMALRRSDCCDCRLVPFSCDLGLSPWQLVATRDYSAKKARAGKDVGKPDKSFSKIANKAAKKYGSKAAGKRVADAVLAKQRAKGK